MTIECLKFKQFTSGSLRGFADFRIHDTNPSKSQDFFRCAYFSKDGKRWILLPSTEYFDPETNEKKYSRAISFVEKERNSAFSTYALKALDKYVSDQSSKDT